MNVPFIDKRDVLFVDTALGYQTPYVESDTPISCSTLAVAQKAGWIWDIGLSERRGVGYVYSSAHMKHEEAELDFSRYLGKNTRKPLLEKYLCVSGIEKNFGTKTV